MQDANIKITTDITDIFGVTGRQLLEKIIEGSEITDEILLELTSGKGKSSLRAKLPQIKKGLKGTTREHHRKMLKLIYDHLKYLEEEIEQLNKMIDEACEKYKTEVELLDTIPGVNEDSAKAIIAEIGVDMKQFWAVKHLTSWAGMSPGNNESAGKKKEDERQKETKH